MLVGVCRAGDGLGSAWWCPVPAQGQRAQPAARGAPCGREEQLLCCAVRGHSPGTELRGCGVSFPERPKPTGMLCVQLLWGTGWGWDWGSPGGPSQPLQLCEPLPVCIQHGAALCPQPPAGRAALSTGRSAVFSFTEDAAKVFPCDLGQISFSLSSLSSLT